MIEIKQLCKRYGGHTAVSDLDITIESGKIYGFLGPNGAGKSTTMNIITGCLAATSGQVIIDGYDIFEQPVEAKRLIGYLPEQPPVYQDMTPNEYLYFVARAKGVSRANIKAQIANAKNVTKIEDVSDRLIRHLSKGYRQRVGIAQAILGEPKIIILDEPTVGLDPKQIIETRDLIRELGKTHTVILSSHILSEVRSVCDVIMIISQGRLVATDTPANLEKLYSQSFIKIRVRADFDEVRQVLTGVSGVVGLVCTGLPGGFTEVDISTDSSDGLEEAVFFAFSDARLPIVMMQSSRASLEDIFIELTQPEQHEPEMQEEEGKGAQ